MKMGVVLKVVEKREFNENRRKQFNGKDGCLFGTRVGEEKFFFFIPKKKNVKSMCKRVVPNTMSLQELKGNCLCGSGGRRSVGTFI